MSGLSWKEEIDIRRALNASIRRPLSHQDSYSSTVTAENGSMSGQQSVDGSFH